MTNSATDQTRILARQLARELTPTEMDAVAGGGPYCFSCQHTAGGDIQTYEKDGPS